MSSKSGEQTKSKTAGDVAISADIALENSIQLGHSVAQEVKILALHGILHLAGFDHERDNGQMARKEAKLRRALRLPAALIERVQPDCSGLAGNSSLKLRRSPRRASGGRSTT
jgi:probable rRNA maturation factor